MDSPKKDYRHTSEWLGITRLAILFDLKQKIDDDQKYDNDEKNDFDQKSGDGWFLFL